MCKQEETFPCRQKSLLGFRLISLVRSERSKALSYHPSEAKALGTNRRCFEAQ